MIKWFYIVRFSTHEFITQFFPNRSKANLAYFWLSCFFALAMTLSLVFIGAGDGIIHRFADAVLGYVEGGGVPVQVQTATLNSRQIDVKGMAQLQDETGIVLHPYHEVTKYHLDLPYCSSLEGLPQSAEPWWHGIAIDQQNPLWPNLSYRGQNNNESFPLTLTLNRAVFTKHFNYDCYKSQLSDLLPANVVASDLPATMAELKVLWLKTKGASGQGKERVWLPYHIKWTATIGGIDKNAFLMPLATFEVFQFVQQFNKVQFFHETDGRAGKRYDQLAIYGYSNEEDFKVIKGTVSCLNALLSKPTITYKALANDIYIKGLKRLNMAVIERCSTPLRLAHQAHEFIDKVSSLPVIYDAAKLAVLADCKAKPSSNRYQCIESRFGAQQVNFTYAWTFITDIGQLKERLQKLQRFKVRQGQREFTAFRFSDYYTDAIHRFDFIVSAIKKIGRVLSSVMAGFFIFIITVKMAVLVGGRKRYFAKYLTSFLSVRQLYFSFCWQIGLASTIGFIISIGTVGIIRHWLNSDFQQVVHLLGYSLNLDPNTQLDLLPLTLYSYTGVFVGLTLVAWLVCCILLQQAKLTAKVEVTEYLVD